MNVGSRARVFLGFILASASFLCLGGASVPSTADQTVATRATTLSPPTSKETDRAFPVFAQAWNSINAYSTMIHLYERNGTSIEHLVIFYSLRKPSTVVARIVAGTKPGATLYWDGGDTITGRRSSGFAALFKKKFSLHDPAVSTIRGSSIDELSFGAMLEHLNHVPGLLQVTPDGNDGTNEALTIVPADPVADAGLTREVYVIARDTHMPIRVLGYTGATLVRDIEFTDIVISAQR